MEEVFTKKWGVPAIDAAISCENKSLTCPIDNAQGFKNPTDKKLESLLKASSSVSGAVVQPAVAAIGICQFLKEQMKQIVNLLPTEEIEVYEDLPNRVERTPGCPGSDPNRT